MKKIEAEKYTVISQPDSGVVTFQGALRLGNVEEYQPILALLDETLANISQQGLSQITVDLRELEFLNSSGIHTFSKFFLKAQNGGCEVIVKASKKIPWQSRMLKNIGRVIPSLQLEFS